MVGGGSRAGGEGVLLLDLALNPEPGSRRGIERDAAADEVISVYSLSLALAGLILCDLIPSSFAMMLSVAFLFVAPSVGLALFCSVDHTCRLVSIDVVDPAVEPFGLCPLREDDAPFTMLVSLYRTCAHRGSLSGIFNELYVIFASLDNFVCSVDVRPSHSYGRTSNQLSGLRDHLGGDVSSLRLGGGICSAT